MNDEFEAMAEALAFIMDGEPLTTTSSWPDGFQRQGRNRALLVERACWLRATGMSYYRIGRDLGIAADTARAYVAAAAPELVDYLVPRRVGKPPGKYGKLCDGELRALYRLHRREGFPVSELARQIAASVGYASAAAARVGILNGWRRLGFRARTARLDSPRQCSARAASTEQRCTRWALIGSQTCAMHDTDPAPLNQPSETVTDPTSSLTAGDEAA